MQQAEHSLSGAAVLVAQCLGHLRLRCSLGWQWQHFNCSACACCQLKAPSCGTVVSASGAASALGAQMASGLATVLAKLDALISAIKAESGFLERR
jgi:hypothetical protein